MKLRDLQAEFVTFHRHTVLPKDAVNGSEKYIGTETTYVPVLTLQYADGIVFLCPRCYAENQGPIGTHSVLCWFRGRVPDDALPGPGRWSPEGTGIDDLTFVPGDPAHSVSVALTSGCGWHGFVRNGDAT